MICALDFFSRHPKALKSLLIALELCVAASSFPHGKTVMGNNLLSVSV